MSPAPNSQPNRAHQEDPRGSLGHTRRLLSPAQSLRSPKQELHGSDPATSLGEKGFRHRKHAFKPINKPTLCIMRLN